MEQTNKKIYIVNQINRLISFVSKNEQLIRNCLKKRNIKIENLKRIFPFIMFRKNINDLKNFDFTPVFDNVVNLFISFIPKNTWDELIKIPDDQKSGEMWLAMGDIKSLGIGCNCEINTAKKLYLNGSNVNNKEAFAMTAYFSSENTDSVFNSLVDSDYVTPYILFHASETKENISCTLKRKLVEFRLHTDDLVSNYTLTDVSRSKSEFSLEKQKTLLDLLKDSKFNPVLMSKLIKEGKNREGCNAECLKMYKTVTNYVILIL
jgi:hypothetical protein